MIKNIIQKNKELFKITDVQGESHITNWKRTAFAWSNIPGSVCLAMDQKYFKQAISNPNISGIIAYSKAVPSTDNLAKAVVISQQANEFFYYLHNLAIHLQDDTTSPTSPASIHPSADIAASAIVGNNVSIGKNVSINERCIIHDNTIIGDDCVLYDNVTIGTEGFFSKNILGKKTHIRHFGGVKLGSNCIIHTGTNISRSVNANEYTELDDNVHIGIHSNIGHDCKVGANTDISAKVLLAGRVQIGVNCWVGASSTLSNAVRVGSEANINIGSVVIEDIHNGKTVSGNFAMNHISNLKEFMKKKSL